MITKVFFSFDYERDRRRADQVRDCWVSNPDMKTAGIADDITWQHLMWDGKKAVQKWIDREMQGTPVTVVLIGSETSKNELVDYGIRQSRSLGKALLGIYIHNLKDRDGNIDLKGKNPFENYCIEKKGEMIDLSRIYPSYDWVEDDGCHNFTDWVKKAVINTVIKRKT